MWINDRIEIILLLDNHTTIGPDDQDTNPQFFLISIILFNKLWHSEDRKNEEIGQYFIFIFLNSKKTPWKMS